jgi:quinoprotein glucose dehydrogenase
MKSSHLELGMPIHWLNVIILRVFAVILGVVGLAMTGGGAVLVYYGGSLYYLVIGGLIVIAAVLLLLRRRAGAWLYGLALAITIIWAIWEVGFDGWALLPRLLPLSLLGVWLLLPWTQKPMEGSLSFAQRVPLGSTGLITTAALASVALGSLLFWLLTDFPPDPRFQAGVGEFSSEAKHQHAGDAGDDWPYFGGDLGGTRYTPLDQITRDNVDQLEVAWQVDVGEMPLIGASPIKINNTLYTCNNRNEIFALDAASGVQRWRHDASNGFGGTCRGVAYYEVKDARGTCATRIILGNATAQLRALDAETGELCPQFGAHGVVDLLKGMGDHQGEIVGGYYRVTSAPIVVRDKIIVGGWITDNQYWGAPSGVIRAYDAVTGKFAWAWDLGNPGVHTEPADGEHYTHSTPNSWAPMSGDEELGMVYLPTGSASADFYGGQRRDFDDQFSSSVVALNAESGELVWSFQTLHNNLWDYDVAANATLIDLPLGDGTLVPALVQPTKQGEIYVLNRVTGEPIFEVTEQAVPQAGGVKEERLSPTQPFSNQLPSFRGALLREADMWGLTPIDQLYCRVRYAQARYEGIYTPPGLTPSILYPAAFGAINWGGVSVHPELGIAVVNSNRLANYVQLLTRDEAEARGLKRQRAFGNPSELALGGPQENTPYAVDRPYWLTAFDVPCNAPPYGLLSAIDLNTGHLLWSERFGTAMGSGPLGMSVPFPIPMGTPNHGGALVTKTGIVFIGATKDNLFQAYDIRNGDLLWRRELPGGGGSAPISYTVAGKQYVVIHAGGNGAIRSRFSTKMVAYALPD